MSNKNKLYRSGCTPRVIFYSQTSKGHEYNYGKPVMTINGRNSRHITQSCSTERKLLDYIKPHPQPDSNRTIIPNKDNIDIKRFNKTIKNSKINYGSMDNTFCEIKNINQKPSIKISKNNNKTSSDLLSNFKNEKKILNSNNNNINKNKYSSYIKNKYDYSSEIVNLPGGNKRKINDIKDDYNNKSISKKNHMNSTINCFRERNINSSKMDCLGNSLKQKLNRPYSVSNLKTKYINCRNYNTMKTFTNLIQSSNSIFYKNYYDNNQNNLINNEKTISNYNNDKKYFNNNIYNKENYFINFQNINNMNNNYEFYKGFNNNKITHNNFEKVYKEKNNSLITPYTKRKNMNSHNHLFNEIHQQNNNYSLMNYYGKNYSKKNYSQIELH